jgi:hypothetical protein
MNKCQRDEPIPFDADEARRYLEEGRTRVARLSPPGVWAWAKTNRPALIASLELMKRTYQECFILEDLPMCIKWAFCAEQMAKRIIREYADVTERGRL